MGKVQEVVHTAVEFGIAFALVVGGAYTAYYRGDEFAASLPTSLQNLMKCGQTTPRDILLQSTLPMLTYWVTSLLFFLLDVVVDCTGLLGSWKHRHEGFVPKIIYPMYRRGIRMQLLNVLISFVWHAAVFIPFVRNFRPQICSGDLFPSPSLDWFGFAWKAGVIYALTDVVFFSAHCFAHEWNWLYRNVHKSHHLFVETYGICAAAAHPIEHIVVSLNTVLIPGLIVGLPFHWFTVWLCISSYSTVCGHSGFHFYNLPLCSSIAHDRHHHFQQCEYGIDFVCDRLFKTTYNHVMQKHHKIN